MPNDFIPIVAGCVVFLLFMLQFNRQDGQGKRGGRRHAPCRGYRVRSLSRPPADRHPSAPAEPEKNRGRK